MKNKIHSRITFSFFLLGSLLLSSPAFAVIDKMDGFGVPGIDVGFFFGLGEQDFKESSIAATESYSFGFYALAGVSLIPGVKIGPYGEYHYVLERKSIDGAEDFDGNGYLLGMGISLNIAPFYALVSYSFWGRYTRDLGNDSYFESPQAVNGILGFYISSTLSIDAAYSHIQYMSRDSNIDLGDDKFRWGTFRLSLTFHL